MALRRVGDTVEVLRPPGEPLLDLCLRGGQGRGERCSDLTFALGVFTAVVLCELSLLLDEEGHRVGARARERPLQLGSAIARLAIDERCQTSLRLVEIGVHSRRTQKRTTQQYS